MRKSGTGLPPNGSITQPVQSVQALMSDPGPPQHQPRLGATQSNNLSALPPLVPPTAEAHIPGHPASGRLMAQRLRVPELHGPTVPERELGEALHPDLTEVYGHPGVDCMQLPAGHAHRCANSHNAASACARRIPNSWSHVQAPRVPRVATATGRASGCARFGRRYSHRGSRRSSGQLNGTPAAHERWCNRYDSLTLEATLSQH